MSRLPRIVIPNCPHHVTQRGNNFQNVFFVDDDRHVYLFILKEQSRLYGLEIHGYCLMTNHVHLIAVPLNADSLSKTIGRTNWGYTKYVNRLHNRSGHLWQNRFYSCVLDDEHFIAAMAYVERNPVRAKMVNQSWQYKWSSAKAHVEGIDDSGFLGMDRWNMLMTGKNWQAFLSLSENKEKTRNLRSHTNRGRPLGDDSFLSKLEWRLGHRFRPLPVGRPKGKNKK